MVVIITGGTRGIGKACAEVFEREGWDVVVTSSEDDVRDAERCREIANETMDRYGRIDCLVNNAGIVENKPFLLMKWEEWKDVIDVNLHGAFNMTKAVIYPMMRAKNGGSIINISSVAAIMGMAGQVNYCAAKAGLLGFTRGLSRELSRANIRVNALALGLIETDLTRDRLEMDADQARVKCFVPMARAGDPMEAAEMVHFLASDKSTYMTGSVIRIDGGLGGDDG